MLHCMAGDVSPASARPTGIADVRRLVDRAQQGDRDALERALAAGSEPALTLDAADARYTIAVGKVVYMKRFARESRVGFGSG